MAAIVYENPVSALEVLTNSYSDCFLTNGEVHRALDEVGRVQLNDLLFDHADTETVEQLAMVGVH